MPHRTVRVAPGRTVYHGGGVHGFVAGESVPLPEDHAAELLEGGHVEDPDAPAAAEPAPSRRVPRDA
jgi:hypothetical protein